MTGNEVVLSRWCHFLPDIISCCCCTGQQSLVPLLSRNHSHSVAWLLDLPCDCISIVVVLQIRGSQVVWRARIHGWQTTAWTSWHNWDVSGPNVFREHLGPFGHYFRHSVIPVRCPNQDWNCYTPVYTVQFLVSSAWSLTSTTVEFSLDLDTFQILAWKTFSQSMTLGQML